MNQSVGNFVHDLVEMAKAFDELPGLKHELEQAQDMIQKQGSVIAGREETILKLKAEIETLNNAVRQAEVSRDDAELRFLEADDAKLAAVRAMRHIIDEANGLINIVQPPAIPTPVAVQEPEQVRGPTLNEAFPMPVPVEPQPEPVSVPTPPTAEPSPTQTSVASAPAPAEAVGLIGGEGLDVDPRHNEPTPGQSVTDPTNTSAPLTTGTFENAPMQSVESKDTASSSAPPTYTDEPNPSLDGWDRWSEWAAKMDAAYGSGKWPDRHAA